MVENPTKNTVEYSGLLLIKYRLEMEHNVAFGNWDKVLDFAAQVQRRKRFV